MGAKTRVWIILGAIALAAALYFMPKKGPENKEAVGLPAETKKPGFSIEKFIEDSKRQYRSSQLTTVNSLESGISPSANPPVSLLDSLAKAWDDLKQPAIAAHYYERKASTDKAEASYLNAAYRYFDAFKSTEDTVARAEWVARAISNYEKVLAINPENLNAKTDLGVCYAEGTGEPMKGIMLLREVITTDPNHENAQLNLGFLSVKSGQYAKAMERFDKVLAINPKRIDVYIYKGETALQMGDKKKATEYFEKFMKESPDEDMKMQVQAYIDEVKKMQ